MNKFGNPRTINRRLLDSQRLWPTATGPRPQRWLLTVGSFAVAMAVSGVFVADEATGPVTDAVQFAYPLSPGIDPPDEWYPFALSLHDGLEANGMHARHAMERVFAQWMRNMKRSN